MKYLVASRFRRTKKGGQYYGSYHKTKKKARKFASKLKRQGAIVKVYKRPPKKLKF